MSVGAQCPGVLATNPGLQKLLFGIWGFPLSITLVNVLGAELFTGNVAFGEPRRPACLPVIRRLVRLDKYFGPTA